MRCPTSVAEVCIEWVRLTAAGLRASFRATADNPSVGFPAHVSMRQAMSEIWRSRVPSAHCPDGNGMPSG